MRGTTVIWGTLAAMLVLAGASQAISQDWYLTDQAHPHAEDGALLLTHTPPVTQGTVEVPVGTCQTWATAFPAQADLDLLKDGWIGHLPAASGSVLPGPVTYPAAIGPVSGETGFSVALEADVRFEQAGDDRMVGLLNDQAETQAAWQLPQGHVLGLEVCNLAELRDDGLDQEPAAMILELGPEASLTTPASQTSVPTPEIATLALTGLGLTALVVARRWGG